MEPGDVWTRGGILMWGEVPEASRRVQEKAKAVAERRNMHEVFTELVEKRLASGEEIPGVLGKKKGP